MRPLKISFSNLERTSWLCQYTSLYCSNHMQSHLTIQLELGFQRGNVHPICGKKKTLLETWPFFLSSQWKGKDSSISTKLCMQPSKGTAACISFQEEDTGIEDFFLRACTLWPLHKDFSLYRCMYALFSLILSLSLNMMLK